MKEILIDIDDFESLNIHSCIVYDNPLYNKLHDRNIHVGDNLHLIVEDSDLWCDVLVEDIEYGDGTIWLIYLGDNSHTNG